MTRSILINNDCLITNFTVDITKKKKKNLNFSNFYSQRLSKDHSQKNNDVINCTYLIKNIL